MSNSHDVGRQIHFAEVIAKVFSQGTAAQWKKNNDLDLIVMILKMKYDQ